MSVSRNTYRVYAGPVTSLRTRVLVLARYGFAEAWSSKITVTLFIVSLLPVLFFLVAVYLANNPMVQALVFRNANRQLNVNAAFFLEVLNIQSWIALIFTAWICPRLISFDLSDNALPILLSHPISRFDYLLGKFLAIFTSLSAVTWIPCFLLFAYQGYASSQPWIITNLPIAFGLFTGSLVWIFFLSLLGLALSAWVKWRVVAIGVIFAALFVPAGVGAIVSAVLRTKWGQLLNIPVMIYVLWQRLLGAPASMKDESSLPTSAILVMLFLACLICIAILNARIRAREVVRG